MDFFNSKPANPANSNPYDGLETPFAQAVNERYAMRAPPSLLTTKFTPTLPLQTPMIPSSGGGGLGMPSLRAGVVPRLSSVPQGAVMSSSAITTTFTARYGQSAPSTSSPFASLLPEELLELIPSTDILLIDIRTHGLFQVSRLPGAISLVIPAMLLNRPNYPLEKMATMMNDPKSRLQFNRWKSFKRIVGYDVDTSLLSDTSNISGLLRKFQAAGFQGELNWLKGGFNAFDAAFPDSVDNVPLTPPSDESEESTGPVLRTRNLSTHAFMQSSTTLIGQMTPRGNDRMGTASSVAANPFYDNIRQNIELSQGADAKIPLDLPLEVLARKNELPFKWLRDLVDQAIVDPQGEELAMQFYRIELGEQRRLQNVMDHHSHESSSTPGIRTTTAEFPYSITAGIEMGTKNRYRNIWPFEHARVRLQTPREKGGSDYVNASFVHSIVSSRRYIATQGPLDSTFSDFWAVCWEQNVPVIVMLTREIESSQRKCGNYWKDGRYGDFDLKLLKQTGAEEVHKQEQGGSFYHFPKTSEKPPNDIIERIFQLTNRSQPHAPPRRITHLQYLEWSDMDVPSTPAGLLTLIKRVNHAALEDSSKRRNAASQGPILLHCSAGVGRTGGFILVDSLLAGIRHEIQRKNVRLQSPDLMELDMDAPESVALKKTERRPNPSPPEYSSAGNSSGSETPLETSSGSSFQHSPSLASTLSVTGSSRGGQSSTVVAPKPKKLSHLVVDKLAKQSRASPAAQVVQWSKELLSSSTNPSPFPTNTPSSSDDGSSKGFVNYKLPRIFDPSAASPPFPSSMTQPIREVLEDMREQRMSLCQSLRQYVFVHRAVIEGTLQLVDEIKGARLSMEKKRTSATSPTNEMAWSSTSSISSIGDHASSSPGRAMAGRLSSSEGLTSHSSSSPPPHPKLSTGKRSASSGESRLAKIAKKKKFKNTTASGGGDSAPPSASARPYESVFRGRW